MSASDPIVLVDRKDGLAVVTLNRPDALNALSNALVATICETFEQLAVFTFGALAAVCLVGPEIEFRLCRGGGTTWEVGPIADLVQEAHDGIGIDQ